MAKKKKKKDKSRKKRLKDLSPDKRIEAEIQEMTDQGPREKGEPLMEYLCRLASPASDGSEKYEALSDHALGWARAFVKAPDVLTPKQYLAALPVESDEDEYEAGLNPTPTPRRGANRRDPHMEFFDELKPEASKKSNVSFEWRKFIIRNRDMSFGEAWERFPYRLNRSSGRTIFYNTTAVVKLLIQMGLLDQEQLDDAAMPRD